MHCCSQTRALLDQLILGKRFKVSKNSLSIDAATIVSHHFVLPQKVFMKALKAFSYLSGLGQQGLRP